jgi:hypothetical protein
MFADRDAMRADAVLPLILVLALAVMVVYARSGDGEQGSKPEFATSPVSCTNGSLFAQLNELPEASGLAASRHTKNLFWSFNDSAEPMVFGLGGDGNVRGRFRVAGASVTDWEAIATAPCGSRDCLYVGDIGDNDRARRSIRVYRTPEPAPGDEAAADAEAIEAVYPEGPQDAEALFFSGGSLFVVTKGEGTPVRLYRFPALQPGSAQTLQLVATLTPDDPGKPWRITDAAASPDDRWIAMRTNDLVLFFDAKTLLGGSAGTPLLYDVRSLNEPQGEGLAWLDAQTLLLAGEGEGAGTLARLTCSLPG